MLSLKLIAKQSQVGKLAYYVHIPERSMTYYLNNQFDLAMTELRKCKERYEGAVYHPETKELLAMEIISPGYIEKTLKEKYNNETNN